MRMCGRANSMNPIPVIIPLMSARSFLLTGALLLVSGTAYGQEECHTRFQSGEYKGLLSCTASTPIVLQKPFAVREAKGTVTLPNGTYFIANVLVEFRDAKGKITAVRTDSQGRFQFRHLRNGTYLFKTTLSGFSSVIGTVILDKNSQNSVPLAIELPVGV